MPVCDKSQFLIGEERRKNTKIGIVCASDDGLAPFLTMIDSYKVTERAMQFYEGQICDMQAAALFSGVCKVNAAIATQILMEIFGENIVINAGAAGGMDPWLKTIFFEADRELIKISERAVKETEPKGKVFWGWMLRGDLL